MSLIATAVKHLLAAGVTGDALVAAIADMEANAPAPIVMDPRPSKGALRMRALRERERLIASQIFTCDASDADVTDSVTETSPSPSPLLPPQTPPITPLPLPHPEGKLARTRGAGAWPCPEGVDPIHWADLLANRKSKRLTNTPTALKGLLRDLAQFADEDWPPGRIVQHAAERGWGAIFDPRPKHGNHHDQRSRHHRPGTNGFLGAIIDAERDDRVGSRV